MGAGLGHEGGPVLFKNVGNVQCSLYGYPGVAALNESGQQVAQAQPTYASLLVTPPTSKRSVRITLSLPGCTPIQAHPVVPGTTGSTTSTS